MSFLTNERVDIQRVKRVALRHRTFKHRQKSLGRGH